VSRRRRKLDCGHARLCVCLSAAACLHYCTDPDRTWGSGRDAASCALLGRFAIGARAALLWQHNANPSYKCERETLASTLVSPAMGHWGTCLPSTSNNFLVNFRAAQSLTATLCGCLSKHYLYSATAAAVGLVQSRLHEPCSVFHFISRHFVCDKVSYSFVPPSHKILTTPLALLEMWANAQCDGRPAEYR